MLMSNKHKTDKRIHKLCFVTPYDIRRKMISDFAARDDLISEDVKITAD
jgi:hypothetical protein